MNPDPTSLDRLHDLVVPPPTPWWPPAAGWYWVIGLLLILAIYFAIRGLIHFQRNRYRREALVEWRKQNALLTDAATRVAALTSLAELLKRTAISAFPRERVATLTGSQWLTFLDQVTSTREFDSDAGQLLERAAYGQITTSDLDESRTRQAATLVHRWISHHRVKRVSEG